MNCVFGGMQVQEDHSSPVILCNDSRVTTAPGFVIISQCIHAVCVRVYFSDDVLAGL